MYVAYLLHTERSSDGRGPRLYVEPSRVPGRQMAGWTREEKGLRAITLRAKHVPFPPTRPPVDVGSCDSSALPAATNLKLLRQTYLR